MHRAYEKWGYGGGLKAEDTVWLAEAASELIGVVRIAPEENVLVLRRMRIAEPWQRRGVGSKMLFAVAEWLASRECYCLPYAHLVAFYGQIGFVEISPAAVPSFLARRLTEYRFRALDTTLMARGAATSYTRTSRGRE